MGLCKNDIHLVDFNPAKGGEIGKLRPAIIMSQDEDNAILATVIVIPLSIQIEPNALPYRLTLPKREKLEQMSDACINEIRSLSKSRIKEKLGMITDDEAKIITKALCELMV
ncbi:MAG: type II toxin-antitoxin system PemK/MazF family toxin [Sulfuricurvum sp.]|nr:type II toxin-antitoxin system PemK/MazF family toxin [Sulfuricurvum sp.]